MWDDSNDDWHNILRRAVTDPVPMKQTDAQSTATREFIDILSKEYRQNIRDKQPRLAQAINVSDDELAPDIIQRLRKLSKVNI